MKQNYINKYQSIPVDVEISGMGNDFKQPGAFLWLQVNTLTEGATFTRGELILFFFHSVLKGWYLISRSTGSDSINSIHNIQIFIIIQGL